jgi:hypothetical protein
MSERGYTELCDRTSTVGNTTVKLWGKENKLNPELPFWIVTVENDEGRKLAIPCDTGSEALDAYRHPYGVLDSYLHSGRLEVMV